MASTLHWQHGLERGAVKRSCVGVHAWTNDLGLGSVATSTYGIHLRLTTVVGQDDTRWTSRQYDGLLHSFEGLVRHYQRLDSLQRTPVPLRQNVTFGTA